MKKIIQKTIIKPDANFLATAKSLCSVADFSLYERIFNNLEISEVRYHLPSGKCANMLQVENKNIKKPAPAVIYCTGGIPLMAETLTYTFHYFFRLARAKHCAFLDILESNTLFFPRYCDVATNLVDKMGGEELETITSLKEIFSEIESVDTDNIGIMGMSRGGITILQTLRSVDWIKCAMLNSPTTNFEEVLEARENFLKIAVALAFDINNQDEIDKRNATKWLNELPTNIPMLINQGIDDKHIPVCITREFVEKYKPYNQNIDYKEYDDDHFLLKNYEDVNKRIVDFFKKHLGVKSSQ